MKKISVIFGTRPEAIKLAPVIIELKKHQNVEISICITAQHREMLDQILAVFNITPDVDLNLMQENQSLAAFTAKAITSLNQYFIDRKSDICIIQGDTTTVMAASIAAFYNKVKIAHVEAGLRTWNMYAPWPEEMNRVLASRLAEIHFAPTEWSKKNLLKEGINEKKIHVVGNTVIDALNIALEMIEHHKPLIRGLPNNSFDSFAGKKVVLITGHRRENFGDGFENICRALSELSSKYKNVIFIYPVHLNPNVQEPVKRILGVEDKKNLFLLEPQPYLSFVSLMNRSDIILTDSGGVQEEALSLKKPILVMRDNTERPEGIEAGLAKLIGTNKKNIIKYVSELIDNKGYSLTDTYVTNPYGDGKAAIKIVSALLE